MMAAADCRPREGNPPMPRAAAPAPLLKRLAGAALAGGMGLAVLGAGLTLAPHQALAWWNGGVWVAGPAYYPPPPVVVAPPPVYYAPPPPVYYAPPPVVYAPPPVYFPPQPATQPVQQSAPVGAGGSCVTPARSCSMTVARAPGARCYCTDSYGQQVWGSVQ